VLTEFVSVAETGEVPAVSDRLAAVSVAGPTVVVCADRVRVSVSVTVSVRVGEPVGVDVSVAVSGGRSVRVFVAVGVVVGVVVKIGVGDVPDSDSTDTVAGRTSPISYRSPDSFPSAVTDMFT
jgi:hypothetical protein